MSLTLFLFCLSTLSYSCIVLRGSMSMSMSISVSRIVSISIVQLVCIHNLEEEGYYL
jgi:hypothetical protein